MSKLEQTYLVGPTLSLRAVEEADAASEPLLAAKLVSPRKLRCRSEDRRRTGGRRHHPRGGAHQRRCHRRVGGDLVRCAVGVLPAICRALAYGRARGCRDGGNRRARVAISRGRGWQYRGADGNPRRPAEGRSTRSNVSGARRCYRYREAKIWRGERRDLLAYPYFNKRTLSIFGERSSHRKPDRARGRSPAPKHGRTSKTHRQSAR